ncbi:mothers against decapentaplegic homolog 6-like [Diorhabda carinulata]|uniref:mothers against decapentaplegic homolog 6-like n=1 Tax=Diorhabda sublineata TaxID=1163346 RepID=UPI0024E0DA44|nr:mothers against decapentaplegic homolog 6-like [Diorhabda sublineata]XP_057659084.1 mothers against decapentaplegic homolog 6-like [Diorhabda carinulata]
MFMFRSKKTNLIRRLEKARKRRGNETRRSVEEETEIAVGNIYKKLQENQLEMLLRAIDTRGHDLSNCVLLPRTHGNGDEPHVLFCQMWRWPDLRKGTVLRRLPMCRSACDLVYDCCNPYHWSRLWQPEIPPPPYSRINTELLQPEDRAPKEVPLVCRDSFPGSLTTNGDSVNPQEWCRLAYWELSNRVGPLFPVERPDVNIFGKVSHPDGLSLETLAQHSFSPPKSAVEKARCKIGLGVTLSREGDCVWIYNRSDNPIFVNSLTLEDSNYPLPTKVPAEHCLCVYNLKKAAQQNFGWNYTHPQIGPVDPNSIRISFVKGWGPKYSRREITSCPCWLEILLAPCR